MSLSRLRCSNCPGRHFSTLLEAVQHVTSERSISRHVQCCVQGCSKRVRKLRQHIRKSHNELCPVSCSACPAKFVERNDLNNHQRNGCPRRKLEAISFPEQRLVIEPSRSWLACLASPTSVSLGLKSTDTIETFRENVDFSDSCAVNNFITKNLQLDEASRNDFSRVVDLLYQYLQHNLPSLSINKLVKGGSVGKGTAVKDKADIDCVVFPNNVKTMKEHKRDLPETKNRLESCLKKSPFKGQITFDKQTLFAVKFKLRLDYLSPEFHIDLLPTFTTDQSRAQLYKEMIDCPAKDRGYYSAHFVSLQVEFVKGQLPIVKNLIRLVKYWRKTCIEDKSSGTARLPSSYPLELITIACWEYAAKPLSFDIRAGFKAVLQQLVDNCHIHLIWYNYYNEAIAKKGIKAMESTSPPFVLDPANPTNNVCSASNAEGWKTVADVAKMTLGRQPLKDVIFNRNWQII